MKKITRKISSIVITGNNTVYLLRYVSMKHFCTIHSMPAVDNYNLPTKYTMGCLMNPLYAHTNVITKAGR